MAVTASKRINVDDFMMAYGIAGYCSSAYGWMDRILSSGIQKTRLRWVPSVPAAEKDYSLATATRTYTTATRPKACVRVPASVGARSYSDSHALPLNTTPLN